MSEHQVAQNAALALLAGLAFFLLFSLLRIIRGEFTVLSSLIASIVLGIIAFVFFYFRDPIG